MKNSLKVILSGLAITCLMYAGCKKADIQPIQNEQKPQISEGEVAQRLAMQISGSLSAQLNGNKLATSSKNGLTTMGGSQCGDFTITPTNKTYLSGDTTITEKGNSIFTLVCNEVKGEIPSSPNGYILDDTLHTTKAGKGFLNTFISKINYNVANQQGIAFYLTGTSYAYAKFATVKKDNITEYHDFSTRYGIQILGPVATKESPAVFSGGQITFASTQEDFYKEDSKKNASYRYSGYMVLSRDIITSYFQHGPSEMVKYEIDIKTGKIISGPTIVK